MWSVWFLYHPLLGTFSNYFIIGTPDPGEGCSSRPLVTINLKTCPALTIGKILSLLS